MCMNKTAAGGRTLVLSLALGTSCSQSTVSTRPDGADSIAPVATFTLDERPTENPLADSGPATPAQSFLNRHEQSIPQRYRSIVALLEHLAQHAGRDLGGIPPAPLSAATVASSMSENGVVFIFPNLVPKEREFSAQELKHQVDARSGLVYEALSHLGQMYAEPGDRYSHLSFTSFDGGVWVEVGRANYRLRFVEEDGNPVLSRCEYLPINEGPH